jgi:GNAT superfamily N-acetyltransferase
MSFSIHRFVPEEMAAYRAIRLEALEEEPGMFGNSYATEAAYEDQVWRARLENPFVACFGLYRLKHLIGLTSIVSDEDKPEEAYMTQSYIRKPFRGRGLSRMLYDARFEWARERGIKRLIIGHRESNIISKAANQRYGFKYSHRIARLWPDGGKEDMLYYTLEL